jgi:hypothetical protein
MPAKKITKPHKKAQKITGKVNPLKLNIRQEQALALILEGKRDREAAEALGVNRETVTGWRLYHPAFKAKLNEARRTLWEENLDRLRRLLPLAVDTLEDILNNPEHPQRWKVALELVKNLSGAAAQVESTNPQELMLQDALRRAEAESKTPPPHISPMPLTEMVLEQEEKRLERLLSGV